MFLSIILLPLLGSIVSGFFGRKVGVNGAQWMTCISIIITAVLVVLAFFEVGFNNSSTFIYLFRWIESEWFNIIWSFQFDSLTVSMLIPVLIISSLVHIYSLSYMSNDPHNQRFFSYLSLFTFMMIILVTANNYLLMFVGWEGVGVCSFLLVSFWFTRIAANQSSMSAFLTNRVGDCFLTIGMFVLIWSLGNLDYATIFSLAPYLNENIITLIGICLLIGAMAKSSQIGLHIWLPMAMEGPTPVSALIHAATMVTAGVYLLMRSSPLIEYSSNLLLLCLWLGAITTVFSSLIGLFQQDIKKVIAYSTMSQLGMMVIAIGLSSYNIALFHLINHAFYKGLLFLGAGSVIHAVVDNQDFRRYGGLVGHLPLTYSVMFIASLSLVAFPYMTGFFSKDLILESAFGNHSFGSIAIYVIATIGAIFTTLYSVKVLYLTFIAKPNGSLQSYKYAHEGNVFLSLPLVLLAIFSIFFGFITKEIFIGLGSDFFVDNSLFIHPLHEIFINTEFAVPVLFKLLPFVFTLVFGWLTYAVLEYGSEILINFKFSRFGYNLFGFFNQRFLIEMFYNKYIVNSVLNLGGQTTKSLDKGSLELIGPFGLEKHLVYLSASINSLSKSNPVDYALFFVIGSILLLFTLFLDIHVILLIILLLGFITLFTNFSEKLKTLESTFIVKLFSTKRLFSTTNVCYVSDSSDDDDYNSDRHYVGNLENQNNYNDSSSNSESPRSNDSLDAIETADRFRGNPQGYREHYDRIEERTRTDYQERITTVLNSRLPEEERNARIGALRSNLEDELGYFEEDFNAGLERVNATQEELNAIDENRTRPEIQDALSTIRMRDEMHTQNLLNRDLDSQSPPSLSEDDSVQNIVISSRNSVNPEENQLLNENNNDNQEIKSDNSQEAKSDNSQEAISDNSQEVKSDNNQEIKSDNSQEIKSDDGNSNNPESESDNINENKGDPANSSEIENSDLNPVNQPNLMPEDNIISTEEENKITETDVKDKLDDTINQEGESSKSENQNKRSHSEVESSSDSEERPTKKTKESLIDYVLEKQACEMPDIPESDGGGD